MNLIVIIRIKLVFEVKKMPEIKKEKKITVIERKKMQYYYMV